MFSSNRKTEPAAPPIPEADRPPVTVQATQLQPSPNSARHGGFLSSGVSIDGSVKCQSELLIDGAVEGTIDSKGTLTIGEHARINGEVKARSIIVKGTVEGDIFASERCELTAGCTLRGDIEAPRLVVDENATFIGSAKIATKKG
jgi:cytoskeletal protein CcmA (bactofilin family)